MGPDLFLIQKKEYASVEWENPNIGIKDGVGTGLDEYYKAELRKFKLCLEMSLCSQICFTRMSTQCSYLQIPSRHPGLPMSDITILQHHPIHFGGRG